jgi:dTDP-4-dehydrorhamnose reductase
VSRPENSYNSGMKIALIGADGQLGSDLLRALAAHDVAPLYFPAFDVTRPDAVRAEFAALKPEVVINTAAFHRVDECEDRIAEAFRVNAFAVRDLAGICRDLGATLVHFSTDYVFDGRKTEPYVEDDPPFPLSVYGASKLAGEYFLRALTDRHILIRTCGLYGLAGSREKGTNFVEAMIRLADVGRPIRVVDDQWVTPTSTEELAARIAALLPLGRMGLFHLTNEGRCTWFGFARAIFELLGKTVDLRPVDSAAFGSKARRPGFSVLENRRAKEIGLPAFSDWRDALRDYLGEKGLI